MDIAMIACILLLEIFSAQGGAQARPAADLEARWRREYPIAAEKLEGIARSFLAKGAFNRRAFFGETVIAHELTVASAGDKRLYVGDRRTLESPKVPRHPHGSVVRCETPQDVFELTKESHADPYVLVYYSSKFPDDVRFNYDYDMCSRCSTVYMQQTLLSRMQSASFVVSAAESVQAGGSEVVRINYDYDSGHHTESGAVYLDPSRDWAIRKVDVISKSEGIPHYEFKSEVDYEKVGDGVFFPKRMEFFGKTQHADVYTHARLDLNQITVGDPPAEVFKLTAYGLPDIPLRPVPVSSVFSFRNPLFWGSLATAVVCFVLLRVTRSRKGKTSVPTAP